MVVGLFATKTGFVTALVMLSTLHLTPQAQSYEFEPVHVPAASLFADSMPLEGTEWRLARLGDVPITSASPQREAYFSLAADTHRVSGSGGCNRLMGSYQLDGDALTFGQMATTMMACPSGMDTERTFLNTLSSVRKWKIAGQQLDLLDADGKVLAHFESRNSK
jgi:heat shock protein HslJ